MRFSLPALEGGEGGEGGEGEIIKGLNSSFLSYGIWCISNSSLIPSPGTSSLTLISLLFSITRERPTKTKISKIN